MMSVLDLPIYALVAPRKWAVWFFYASTITAFAISQMALAAIGFNYDSSGGALWQKLHPATYAAALALMLEIFAPPRPLRRMGAFLRASPGLAYFLAMWLLTLVYGVWFQKLPIAAFIDTYLIAIVLLVMDDNLTGATRRVFSRSIHALIFVNALIGIGEYFTRQRLFPYIIAGVEVEGDYRSTALFGHPLLNASTTGAYVICLALGGDPGLSFSRRTLLMGTGFLGLVAFGGRTALVTTAAILAVQIMKSALAILSGARFDGRRMFALMIAAPICAGLIGFALFNGAFDALLERFTDDNGSAKARVIMFELFQIFDMDALLFGPRQDLVVSALSSLGIQIGIENTWVALVFQYGLWMTAIFVFGLVALFWEFWRRTRRGGGFLFFYFIIIISSAIGLAAKTMIFNQFILVLMFVFHAEDLPPGGEGFMAQRASRHQLPMTRRKS